MSKNRLTPYRARDILAILETLAIGQPVAVVGLSNFGKSTLLRHMTGPDVTGAYRSMTGRAALFVYIDCNLMLEMSAQGFYEVILRAILEALAVEPGPAALTAALEALYQKVIEGHSAFAVPLAFNDAMVALMTDDGRDVILMLDEFDAVLSGLDERVFLNLRALKDKYAGQLNYVMATLQPPSLSEGGDDLAEFLEPFVPYKYYLKPLDPAEATALAADIFHQANDSLDPPERDFILAQAGGHPGLIQAVAHVVLEVESGAPAAYTQQALLMAGEVLHNHRLVRGELARLWKQLLPAERTAVTLIATQGINMVSGEERAELYSRGLLVDDEGGPRLFAQLFADYARRQALVQQAGPDGVWVDIDAGMVWVGGQVVEALTDLEYRLLLLLYGRMDKLCDKYQIVETVWGQDYLGEVDDARIEKLVSRLRAKIEPDPARPRFVVTVRGRGYRLQSTRAAEGIAEG